MTRRRAFRKFAAGFEENLAAALLGLLLVAMCWQVITRYALGAPSDWTEEACRYLYVYVVFLGTSAGISSRSHVSVAYFADMLAPLPKLVLSLAVDALILAFLAIMVWWGTKATARNLDIPLSVTQLSYAWVYVVIPVTSVLMIVRTLLLMRLNIERYRAFHVAPEDHQRVII